MDVDLILQGDCTENLKSIQSGSVNTCITSPPYYNMRDYGVSGQIGTENTVDEYIRRLVDVFSEVRRVLSDDGTLWLNLGDTYAMPKMRGGKKPFNGYIGSHQHYAEGILPTTSRIMPFGAKVKDLLGIPWSVAYALQESGWLLVQDIIWHKINAQPESVKDRPTKAHEYLFLFAKSPNYYYDAESISHLQTGSVWSITIKPFHGPHFATFPKDLVEPCILAGSKKGGVVLDPFLGSGTTCATAKSLGRHWIGCELNPENVELAKKRIEQEGV